MVAFAPGAVLTAANLNTAFNALTIRTVTGVSDTLVLADNGGCVTYSNAAATTSTIPPNSSVAYAVGTKIVLVNLGAGVVTVTAGAGVTINGTPLTLAQDAGGTCIKTATNTWSFLPFSSGVGNAVYSDADTGTYTGYAYKTFAASGTLTVTTAGFADIVLVAGGGAGIGISGGGGGAGGLLQVINAYLPVGTLTVTVGAGGAVAGGQTAFGPTGNGSRLGDYYAIGGGGCWDRIPLAASGGGSGGGGSYGSANYTGGKGIAGQGFDGGTGAATASAGGGGGAGAVGANGAGTTGGAGGSGVNISIAGTTPTGAYVAGNYTAGGGGGASGDTGGSASFGGGAGANAASGNGTAGTANKGGGGGGSTAGLGGNGGSGILIVRVAV